MTTTARGNARARYEANAARHRQGGRVTEKASEAAPMAPATTPWGRVADAATEAGWWTLRQRRGAGGRVVSAQLGTRVLTMVWDEAGSVLSASVYINTATGVVTRLRDESGALRALRG